MSCQGEGSEVILFGGVDAKAPWQCSKMADHCWNEHITKLKRFNQLSRAYCVQEYPLSKKGHSHELAPQIQWVCTDSGRCRKCQKLIDWTRRTREIDELWLQVFAIHRASATTVEFDRLRLAHSCTQQHGRKDRLCIPRLLSGMV